MRIKREELERRAQKIRETAPSYTPDEEKYLREAIELILKAKDDDELDELVFRRQEELDCGNVIAIHAYTLVRG